MYTDYVFSLFAQYSYHRLNTLYLFPHTLSHLSHDTNPIQIYIYLPYLIIPTDYRFEDGLYKLSSIPLEIGT